MLRLGIIGTGWIADQFIEAAHQTKRWQLSAVYSRKIEKAEEFGRKYADNLVYFDKLNDFFESDTFDVVYIASPNSLHFEQAKAALLAGKNVIVEKPIASNPDEMSQLIKILRKYPQQYLFEAARHYHEDNFKVVQQAVQGLEEIQGATLTYMKYSSRYDDFLAGENPNVFSPEFSGGALQDLGVYMVYDALAWFGVPDSVNYYATKLSNGIDGKGIAIFNYPQFEVTLQFGKTANSYLESEIYGNKKTIVMDSAADLNEVYFVNEDGEKTIISSSADKNPMLAEARDFADVLENADSLEARDTADEWLAMAVEVNKVMYKLRYYAKIEFPSDYIEE